MSRLILTSALVRWRCVAALLASVAVSVPGGVFFGAL
jgi:hypothetical protein